MTNPQDLFVQIKNTVLDLQSADFQSYPAQIRKLGRLLENSELHTYNSDLTVKANLSEFVSKSEGTQSGMVGSARLLWPDDDEEILGLKLLLIMQFRDDPDSMWKFGRKFYSSRTDSVMSAVNSVTAQVIIPFIRDYQAYVESQGKISPRLILPHSEKVFIVHGHDSEAKESVARLLSAIGLVPVILNEQANLGMTIVEKIEANADVGFAVVLLTPDDVGKGKDETDLEPRARQNVLLELGYFMARLERKRVCALKKGSVSVPSDFAGMLWQNIDEGGGWKLKLARELAAVGYNVDFGRIPI